MWGWGAPLLGSAAPPDPGGPGPKAERAPGVDSASEASESAHLDGGPKEAAPLSHHQVQPWQLEGLKPRWAPRLCWHKGHRKPCSLPLRWSACGEVSFPSVLERPRGENPASICLVQGQCPEPSTPFSVAKLDHHGEQGSFTATSPWGCERRCHRADTWALGALRCVTQGPPSAKGLVLSLSRGPGRGSTVPRPRNLARSWGAGGGPC